MAYQVYFQYRKKGDSSWIDTTKIDVTISQYFSEYLTDLESLTTYEYRSVLEKDGAAISYSEILEFETLPFTSTPDEVYTITTPIKLVKTQEINGAWYIDAEIMPDDYIQVESYVEIEGELYIVKNIKKILAGDKTYFSLRLYHNMIELAEITVDRMGVKGTPTEILGLILQGSDWTAGECDIDEIVYFRLDKRTTRLEALNKLAELCGGELYWHSKTRIVDLLREIGENNGLQIRYDKNSNYIEKEENSDNLVTRVYPIGADNYTINTTYLDDCEDETDYTPSGAGTTEANDDKMRGSQAIRLKSAALNETFTHDLGAGDVKDLSDHDTLKLWVYSDTDNTFGFTFGIGKAVWSEITVNTGALKANCWKEVSKDISGIDNANKDAIRYIGFKNLTNGAAELVIDDIRAFRGNLYIDSPNIDNYKVNKEYIYCHSASPQKEVFEKVIYTTADTFVNEDTKYKNYGTEWRFKVRDDKNRKIIALIKFPLDTIPIGATIEEAKMYLHVTSTDFKSGATVDVQYANSSWSEYGVNWNNRPESGGNITTFDGNSTGWKEVDIKNAVEAWWAGTKANNGLRFELNITDVDKSVNINSKESEFIPYIKVKYSMLTDPSDVIIAGATDFLNSHDEPELKYKVNFTDLSKVTSTVWEDETVGLGDTCKIYDGELNLNTDVRIIKLTKNLLEPSDTQFELVNKAYTLADLDAKRTKQLDNIMPFKDKPTVIDANTIQAGYFGSEVQK